MLSSAVSLLNQIATIVCGFILPRFFLKHYGSTVNGLISSIAQFLSFISFAELGVGAVVRSAFYKPLAEKNEEEISRICLSSNKFFNRVAYILLAYVIILTIVYPFITLDSFDFIYSASLIVIISISLFAQYFIGMTYKLLIAADQLSSIVLGLQCLSTILNTVLSIILIKLSVSVHLVRFVSSLVFTIQPIVLSVFAHHRYNIKKNVKLQGEPIKQKWNGLAQHIAHVVLMNTDVVVLTLFSTLQNVSIYSVYHLVTYGLKNLVDSFTNGFMAMMGDQYARGEKAALTNTLSRLEWMMHFITTLTYAVAWVAIIPFVEVYTQGITDAEYKQPLFATIMIMAQAAYCYRLPYSILVVSAGHFKQTQNSAIIEAVLNIALSVVFVIRFGIIGVAVGTLVAMMYRTGYFVWYLSKEIVQRKIIYFVKHLIADAIAVAVIVCIRMLLPQMFALSSLTYLSWFILAIKAGVMCLIVVAVTNLVFYPNLVKGIVQKAKRRE